MTILFIILIILASVILSLIVLVQNPKGGGLAGNIAGFSNQFMGVKQTTDVLEKGTLRTYKIDYILADSWSWANSKAYLSPYFAKYGERWRLAWEDKPSGVKVWQRSTPYEEPIPESNDTKSSNLP